MPTSIKPPTAGSVVQSTEQEAKSLENQAENKLQELASENADTTDSNVRYGQLLPIGAAARSDEQLRISDEHEISCGPAAAIPHTVRLQLKAMTSIS